LTIKSRDATRVTSSLLADAWKASSVVSDDESRDAVPRAAVSGCDDSVGDTGGSGAALGVEPLWMSPIEEIQPPGSRPLTDVRRSQPTVDPFDV
jgi:hypothetical protein